MANGNGLGIGNGGSLLGVLGTLGPTVISIAAIIITLGGQIYKVGDHDERLKVVEAKIEKAPIHDNVAKKDIVDLQYSNIQTEMRAIKDDVNQIKSDLRKLYEVIILKQASPQNSHIMSK